MNNLSQQKIDRMCRLGLAGDMTRVNYYVEALMNPQNAVTDSFRRQYLADSVDKILNIISEDQLIYDHIISNLMVRYPNHNKGRSWMEAINRKSIKSNMPANILFEVYNRSYKQEPPPHLTQEQFAFNAE